MFDPYQRDAYDVAHDYVSGPLDGLQQSVAAVLNSSDQNHIYIPTGNQGQPVIAVPRPQQPSVAAAVLRGAVYGLIGGLVWRRIKGRRGGRHRR
jgi:hypothetical protein